MVNQLLPFENQIQLHLYLADTAFGFIMNCSAPTNHLNLMKAISAFLQMTIYLQYICCMKSVV